MQSVLIAPIGDHPSVITAAVDALLAAGMAIDRVRLLYPDEARIRRGAEWAALELPVPCELVGLPFEDARSEAAARDYLRVLAQELEACEYSAAQVYLLLSGGRKSMSALTAAVAPLYPCVQAAFHLVDPDADDPLRRKLFTVEELENCSDAERGSRMHPNPDLVRLFKVPFPRIPAAEAVRRYLGNPDDTATPPLIITPELDDFYGGIFQGCASRDQFTLQLSQLAFEQFHALWQRDRNRAEAFRTCFKQMRDPGNLLGGSGKHGTFSVPGAVFHFYKRRNTAERPLYYTLPNPIHLYPKRPVRQVVVCGLAVEVEAVYEPDLETLLASNSKEPRFDLCDLPAEQRSGVLIASLGDAPMVIPQAYVLLRERENMDLKRVLILYPGGSARISSLADDLATQFRRECPALSVESIPIPTLEDVASEADCATYLHAVSEAIRSVQIGFPDEEVHLLLAGGRKSMAALNLFAAMRAGLDRVWHTLITDQDVEHRLELAWERAGSVKERRELLFLRTFPPSNFDLLPVPLFSMESP